MYFSDFNEIIFLYNKNQVGTYLQDDCWNRIKYICGVKHENIHLIIEETKLDLYNDNIFIAYIISIICFSNFNQNSTEINEKLITFHKKP